MAEGQKITTRDVLMVLGIGAVFVGSIVAPGLPKGVVAAVKAWKFVNRKDLGRIIKRLHKQEMLSIYEGDGKVAISITDKGKRRLLEYNFESLSLKAKRRDGKWRLIIFDIPEGLKRNRDAFAKKLLQIECIKLQDSVYVSAYPCNKEIDFLCHFLEVSDYVTVVILDKFERGEEVIFKKYYDFDNSNW